MDLRNNQSWTPVSSGFPIRSISLDMTSRCNLACEYCFAACNHEYVGSDLTLEMAEKVVDWLLDPTTRGEEQTVDISFWGGEPLIKWELLQQIVLMAEEKGKNQGVGVTFNMTTNGVAMTPDKFPFFEEHNMGFLLSLDGTKKSHDRYRKFRNGKGSWDVIDKNATEILKWRPNQSVRMSLSAENLDNLMDDLNYLYNKGFNDIVYSAVHEGDWTEEKKARLTQLWREISDWYILKKRGGRPIRLKFLDDARAVCATGVSRQEVPCGAGRGYVGIAVDGSIHICHRFHKMEDMRPWYEQEMCLGHVEYGIMNKELRDRFVHWNADKDMMPSCKDCSAYKLHCTGHCWATNYDNCGDIALVPAIGCHINRATADEGAYVFEKLGGTVQASSKMACVCDNIYDRTNGVMHIDHDKKDSCVCNQTTYNDAKKTYVPRHEVMTLDGIARFLDSAIEQADTRAEYLYQRLEELSEKTETNSAMEALDGKG